MGIPVAKRREVERGISTWKKAIFIKIEKYVLLRALFYVLECGLVVRIGAFDSLLGWVL